MRAMIFSKRRSALGLVAMASFAFASAACAAPATTGPVPPPAAGAPCGVSPEEMAAPIASGANYVPPAPSASASAPGSP